MEKPEFSIIIVSYNTSDVLEVCLDSIFQSKEHNFEVVVIDNNSSDDSVEMIRENFKDVVLIQNSQNLGFAKAVNQGLKKAKGDFYLLLNPDAKVKNGAIKKLIDFAKRQRNLGAVGGKLINTDGTIQASCYNLPSVKNAILEFWLGKKGAFEKYYPKSSKPVEVESIVGAAMLIPMKAIEQIGYFDERFFMYYEDLDWCRRAKRLKLKIFWHPDSQFIHLHGWVASKVSQLSSNRLRKSSKIYNGLLKYFLLYSIIFFGQKFRGRKE